MPSDGPFASRADGVCPICETAGRRLVQDHDHRRGTVRARICRRCNLEISGLDRYSTRWLKDHRADRSISRHRVGHSLKLDPYVQYVLWWRTNPSEVPYTGSMWIHGRYSVRRARAVYRSMRRQQLVRKRPPAGHRPEMEYVRSGKDEMSWYAKSELTDKALDRWANGMIKRDLVEVNPELVDDDADPPLEK